MDPRVKAVLSQILGERGDDLIDQFLRQRSARTVADAEARMKDDIELFKSFPREKLEEIAACAIRTIMTVEDFMEGSPETLRKVQPMILMMIRLVLSMLAKVVDDVQKEKSHD